MIVLSAHIRAHRYTPRFYPKVSGHKTFPLVKSGLYRLYPSDKAMSRCSYISLCKLKTEFIYT